MMCRCQRAKRQEGARIGPVDVLEQDQQRRFASRSVYRRVKVVHNPVVQVGGTAEAA